MTSELIGAADLLEDDQNLKLPSANVLLPPHGAVFFSRFPLGVG